jgi:hypothetical protein
MVKIKGLGASLLIGLFLCGCGQAKASSDATSSDSKTATPQPSSSSSVITLHEVFEDYNKAVLWETDVPYGSDIVYAGKAPTTSYDENGVTYTWTGSWDAPLKNVINEYIYKPVYGDGKITQCTANFYADEAKTTLLYTTTVNWNTYPDYAGPQPTKTGTSEYTYEFNNQWSPALSNLTARNNDFVACFDKESVGLVFEHKSELINEWTPTSYAGSATTLYVPSYHQGWKVTYCDDGAFKENSTLQEAYFAEGFQMLGRQSFLNCTALKKLDLPRSLADYRGGAVNGCTSFPADGWNFYNGSSKFSVDSGILYGLSVYSDGSKFFWAFDAASTVSGAITLLGDKYSQSGLNDYVFYGSKITTITLPSNCSAVGIYAFANCSELASIVIPASVNELSDSTFEDCPKLASVTFASGSACYKIGKSVFEDDIALTGFIVPSGVMSIGATAFQNCKALNASPIALSSKIDEIGSKAFDGISGATFNCKATSKPYNWAADWADSTANTINWGV